MRKRTFSSKLVLLLGTAAILGFSACTDNVTMILMRLTQQ